MKDAGLGYGTMFEFSSQLLNHCILFFFLSLWCIFLTIVSNLLVQASKFSLSHLLVVLDLHNFCFWTTLLFATLHSVEWFHVGVLHVWLRGINESVHSYLSQTCHYNTTLGWLQLHSTIISFKIAREAQWIMIWHPQKQKPMTMTTY